MKHYGDITKINGAAVEPCFVVIGGSPCQDLSISGKRAGLAGARSGLYMEQIRIIKEMRENDRRSGRAAVDIRPRYMVWENVPGAFTSTGGDDFRAVLEEAARVVDGNAVIPKPKNGKWSKCGAVVGNGWSIAWTVRDAQFYGVPQRRRRIALVADFNGESAADILFKSDGVPRDIEAGGETRKNVAADIARSSGTAGERTDGIIGAIGADVYNLTITGDVTCALTASGIGSTGTTPKAIEVYSIDMGAGKSAAGIYADQAPTLTTTHYGAPAVMNANAYGASVYNYRIYDEVSGTLTAGCAASTGIGPKVVFKDDESTSFGLDRASFNQGKNAKYDFTISTEQQPTLTARGPGAVCQNVRPRYIVRRLTPTECERLQAFPDAWTDIGEWIDSKGKKRKTTDTARYKALGNSICTAAWVDILQSIAENAPEGERTMASLFDGIGGFPLIWQRDCGGVAVWASEIEEFCIAVTSKRFAENSTDWQAHHYTGAERAAR